ncbi:imidazoleglycerol-phosphate dehydratase HisB [Candidatus Aerophobetes bacterium]|nr:imidazoleglycerol-phosphate dehydratase HisB [Candidatus Aerophobetes bacterium]
MLRQAEITRKTRETEINLYLDLDGTGSSDISTGYPFFDHMLELFCLHGFFNLRIRAKGDIQVDEHHLVEDVGICLGKAFSQALKDKTGIKRYGFSAIPMDEVLAQCIVDISGRPVLVFNIKNNREIKAKIAESFKDFFRAFCVHSGVTLHINVYYGDGYHHTLEAIFKSFGVSLDQAIQREKRRENLPSTKGYIEEV